MTHISVVSPVYNAEKILPELVNRIENTVKEITDDYEIILVEDCGPDNSWEVIENLGLNNPKIRGFKLSRNFGQHYAITCGLDHAKGEWVVVMDCDLQDQPKEIKNLYEKAMTGYDIVLASRYERKDSLIKELTSKLFYRTLGYLTGSEQDETVANFGIYNTKVINVINGMRESIRFFPTMVKWVGFKKTKIIVNHPKRATDKSSYNLIKLMNLASDIILAFSDKPLRLVIGFGLLVSSVSILFSVYIFIKWWRGDIIELGYTSIIISIWLLSGFVISTIGIVALYIGKIFENIKNRPIYIIDKKKND